MCAVVICGTPNRACILIYIFVVRARRDPKFRIYLSTRSLCSNNNELRFLSAPRSTVARLVIINIAIIRNCMKALVIYVDALINKAIPTTNWHTIIMFKWRFNTRVSFTYAFSLSILFLRSGFRAHYKLGATKLYNRVYAHALATQTAIIRTNYGLKKRMPIYRYTKRQGDSPMCISIR